MSDDRDKSVVRYLTEELLVHGPHHRERLTAALGGRKLTGVEDLTRVPAVALPDLGDPTALVLRPRTPGGKGRRADKAASQLEYRYKPVHWVVQSGLLVGSSNADLDRLAWLGARWLAGVGLLEDDVVLGFLPAGPHLPYWQLVLGARHLGVSALHLQPVPRAVDVARVRPTVLVGRPRDVVRLLETPDRRAAERAFRHVRLVVTAGERLDAGVRARLEGLLVGRDVPVVSAWAPPGVRALWWECRPDSALHTWPDAEVVQIVDPLSGEPVPPGADGEVVWTALGWYGSVLLRVRTGVFAALEDGPCPRCGEPGPRLVPLASEPAYLAALDRHRGVAGWQAELRTAGGRDELLVFLTPTPRARLDQLLVELDVELSATQYVVLDKAALDARLAAHDDRRVVDLRS